MIPPIWLDQARRPCPTYPCAICARRPRTGSTDGICGEIPRAFPSGSRRIWASVTRDWVGAKRAGGRAV